MSKKNKVENNQVKKEVKGVALDNLETFKKEDVNKEITSERKGIVNVDDLRLRREPVVDDNNIIKMLQKGTIVTILDDTDEEFYKVDDGYVMKKFIDEK